MDQQRGRSPSGGHQQVHLSHSHSSSPQNFAESFNSNGLGINIDPALQNHNDNQSYSNGNFQYHSTDAFLPSQQEQQYTQANLGDQTFAQGQDFTVAPDYSEHFKQEGQSYVQQSFTQDLLSATTFNDGDFSLYSTPATQSDQQFEQAFYDPSQQNIQQSINPQELMNDMSSPLAHTPTPPHMLHADGLQASSAQQSPSFNQQQFSRSPAHSRHTSLAPESAAFGTGQADWNGILPPQFSNHRRTQSDYSDVSSASPSPNLIVHDGFEHGDPRHSPMMRPQDSGSFQDNIGVNMGNFSLSDGQSQHAPSPRRGMSPSRSPAVSPRLVPQQIPMTNQQSPFVISMGLPNSGFIPSQGPEMYNTQNHNFGPGASVDMGHAQQMVTPEIKFELAPPSRQNSFEPPRSSIDQDALTLPDRGRRRPRAASDPNNSGSSLSRPGTPGLGPLSPQPQRSQSPFDRAGSSSPSKGRRQSTSVLPNRDYFLGLADPEYQPPGNAENGNSKRIQKHPATFQCNLCPKRFTRAYNLRSHLRTHTDERPFVCTVCSKAFARQHDRKRHEGLHSGEKKFVCKGELKQGGQWGCGRRFARADALGRHFRSEAGRICIKPLLDEEAIERQRLWQEQNQLQNMAHNMQQPQPITVDANGFPMDASGNYALPAALLAQYPALANLSWADIPQGDAAMDDEISGRSSFDASGSEYYDEGDEAGYVSGPGSGFGQGHMNDGYAVDYASDYGGR